VKGPKTHINTIHRWVKRGVIEGRHRVVAGRRWLFVRKDQIEALARGEPVQVAPKQPGPVAQRTAERKANDAYNRRILEANGLRIAPRN
jgi:hypothetical protein